MLTKIETIILVFSSVILVVSSAFQVLKSSSPTTLRNSISSKPYFAPIKNSLVDDVERGASGLSKREEDDLDILLDEALFRFSFFMETDYLRQVENAALRDLYTSCIDLVHVQNSTIPQAGRGLFASRDIPKHTIVTFYAAHCIGCKFPTTGLCHSVQMMMTTSDENINPIEFENSQYTLFSIGNRPLCGVDLVNNFNGAQLFVDMNPSIPCREGWYGGLINDATKVSFPGDLDYYPTSRSQRNVEIVPFSTAPFQVAITTRDVAKGEELFASYGYNYWANNRLDRNNNNSDDNLFATRLEAQENQALDEIMHMMEVANTKYAEASWILHHVFDHGMNSQQPPSTTVPVYESKKKDGDNVQMKRRDRKREMAIKKLVLNLTTRLFGSANSRNLYY
eukprot:scaffold1750_cov108-Cylindrotheca_fusiformis.AAC.3